MIAGTFHEGSGLGNQLHRYIACRVAAADLGVEFGMDNPKNFKGSEFMKLEMGKYPQWLEIQFHEKRVENDNHVDVRPYDERFKQIRNNTRIEGEFQAEQYWEHRREDVDKWLAVEPMALRKDICVINFRGGEYKGVTDLYLTPDYWALAVSEMKAKGIKRFMVCTDDVEEAKKFFPDFDISHEIGRDWRMIRYAHNLILSNSSFAILPAWLSPAAKKGRIIAPKFWARRNIGQYWALPQNEYKGWQYV